MDKINKMENANGFGTKEKKITARKPVNRPQPPLGVRLFFAIACIALAFATGPGVFVFLPLGIIFLVTFITGVRKSRKCKRCGIGGFFHKKANSSGFCDDCEKIELKESIAVLQERYNQTELDINKMRDEKTEAVREECEKLSKMMNEKIEAIREEYKKEEDALKKIKAERELIYKEVADSARRETFKELEAVRKEIDDIRNQIIVFDETVTLESVALYQPKFSFQTSAAYKEMFEIIREKQKLLIKTDKATSGSRGFTINVNVEESKKLIDDMKKLLLRSFNNECDYCVDNVKFNNIESHEKRMEKSFESLNKLGALMKTEISPAYKKLKHEELHLAYEYQKKKEEEKEDAKKARQELREQQKLERELKEARERIEKEKKHFSAAIKELETKLSAATDEKERGLIVQSLEETKTKYAELEKEEKVVDYREQNAKAGYVYIISNIGSFGEGVFKIGMTRRLEPMERIDELGDASVPFGFDVHALIFSDNAPALEAQLHEHFYKSRVNRLNNRKEFFKADINEIEKVVKEHYNKIVDMVKEAPAEQYRESLLVEKVEMQAATDTVG